MFKAIFSRFFSKSPPPEPPKPHAFDEMHSDARALATEAALAASSDASLASLVTLWEHEHEVHDLEHPHPRGVRHT